MPLLAIQRVGYEGAREQKCGHKIHANSCSLEWLWVGDRNLYEVQLSTQWIE
jgi:hypothetical protein